MNESVTVRLTKYAIFMGEGVFAVQKTIFIKEFFSTDDERVVIALYIGL